MGHSEMLLAVAGLENDEIRKITQQIGSGDWSFFSPAERQAFFLAYRLSREPGKVSAQDREDLIQTYGQPAALDLIWNISWCNYMTRFADAFQLPLEENNVFAPGN